MPEQDLRAADLILKYLRIGLNEEELRELERWKQKNENSAFFEKITGEEWMKQQISSFNNMKDDEALWQKIATNLPAQAPLVPMNKTRGWWRYAAAAVLIVIAGSIYWYNNTDKKATAKVEDTEKRFKNDVAPGTTGAILTLADGRKIVLDTAANGSLTQQGNANVEKMDGGISYDVNDPSSNIDHTPIYNTMSTPRGRTYQLTLSDGSKVWLNCASSIYFPTAFMGKERKVFVTGEAYFEVVKNAKPFKVVIGETEVEVLGTHFNVSAYEDEKSVQTTLLEGKVNVKVLNAGDHTTKASRILKPGEQSDIPNSPASSTISVQEVNADEVIAWKNGLFVFSDENIKDIMRRLARWYDVEVIFEGNMDGANLVGAVSRSESIITVLEKLELTGAVKFRVEGRKVFVSK
jgi:ferric-dicitrate binding protein FerR (iron transport regulator)